MNDDYLGRLPRPLYRAGSGCPTAVTLLRSIALAGCEQPAPPPSEPTDISRPAQTGNLPARPEPAAYRTALDVAQAELDAAASRARRVVVGAHTTILGVAPPLFDQSIKSMAVTIMFGLASATLLTPIVVPLRYAALLRIQNRAPA
ncbi:hypothetical protein [Thiocapsa bogorovii]|uniref:hypothetical protein n=1 Tax=Thiocapsa bogorovii TaxID=521689 RepID=UPI001E4093C8|nr:hypothetical protein [Thiocapsa bogorovii]UHD17234.1 hypothetical protein LT988_04040 [Thiocapsa bogorovii]